MLPRTKTSMTSRARDSQFFLRKGRDRYTISPSASAFPTRPSAARDRSKCHWHSRSKSLTQGHARRIATKSSLRSGSNLFFFIHSNPATRKHFRAAGRSVFGIGAETTTAGFGLLARHAKGGRLAQPPLRRNLCRRPDRLRREG